jgi:hypothetical protein
MIYDNFISTYLNIHKFVTHDNILSKNAKKAIKLFFKIPSFFFVNFYWKNPIINILYIQLIIF